MRNARVSRRRIWPVNRCFPHGTHAKIPEAADERTDGFLGPIISFAAVLLSHSCSEDYSPGMEASRNVFADRAAQGIFENRRGTLVFVRPREQDGFSTATKIVVAIKTSALSSLQGRSVPGMLEPVASRTPHRTHRHSTRPARLFGFEPPPKSVLRHARRARSSNNIEKPYRGRRRRQ